MAKAKTKTKENKSKSKKIWDFFWKSNSIWSWIVDLILIFLIVKFVIFPVFAFALGAPLPFVIIESGSLEHKITTYNPNIPPNICGVYFNKSEDVSGNFSRYWQFCGDWYEENNITRSEFETWPYLRGMNKGDIIIIKGLKDRNYEKGDIVIFRRIEKQYKTPIIHRIIDTKTVNNQRVFSTKGDHNPGQLDYEGEIYQQQVLGKAVCKIPKLGWAKLFFVELLQ